MSNKSNQDKKAGAVNRRNMLLGGTTLAAATAISAGATHVRVGTALLGGRPVFVR